MIEGEFVTIHETGPAPDGDGVLPECTQESFEAQKAGWKRAIDSKKKTVNDLITTIQTQEILTPDQKVEIASWAVQQGGAA